MSIFDGVMLEIAQEFFGLKRNQDPKEVTVSQEQKNVFLEILNKLKLDLSKFNSTSQQLVKRFAADVENYDKFNVPYEDKTRTKLLNEAKNNLQEFKKFKEFLHTWCAQEELHIQPYLDRLYNASSTGDKEKRVTVETLIDAYYDTLKDLCQEITSHIFIDWDDNYYSFWNRDYGNGILGIIGELPAWAENVATYKNQKDHPMYYMAELIRDYCYESALTEVDDLLTISNPKDKDHNIVVMQVIQRSLSACGYKVTQNELM